jgi:hypothetical protein
LTKSSAYEKHKTAWQSISPSNNGNNDIGFDKCISMLVFSNKFQTNSFTRTPVRTVYVVAQKLGHATSSTGALHIFGTKIDQFPNEILNRFSPILIIDKT